MLSYLLFVFKIFDPAESQLPLLEKPLHFYPPNQEPPAILKRLQQELSEQDAFVFVTAEYNFKYDLKSLPIEIRSKIF